MNEGATYLLDIIKKRRTSRAYRIKPCPRSRPISSPLRIVSFVALGIAANEVRFTESLRILIREKTFHNHYGTMALDRQRKEDS